MNSNNAASYEQQEQLDTDPIITDNEAEQSNLAFLLDEPCGGAGLSPAVSIEQGATMPALGREGL